MKSLLEKDLENLLIEATQRGDFYSFLLDRGFDVSPDGSKTKPKGMLTIHKQPILDGFGRGDIFLQWGKDQLSIFELKKDAPTSDDIGQVVRYREVVKNWYPDATVKAFIIAPFAVYSDGPASSFDQIFLAAHCNISIVIYDMKPDGLHFQQYDKISHEYTLDALKEYCEEYEFENYKPFRITGKRMSKKAITTMLAE